MSRSMEMSPICTKHPLGNIVPGDVRTVTLPEYEPNIGAPFKVKLLDSVVQKVSPSGEILETYIPNLDGLLKEIAFSRALDSRKMSPEELKFVRKAVGLKAIDLAEMLGISPEHVSRCEKGDRTLSPAAEKLLRVIILRKRHDPLKMAHLFESIISNDDLNINQINQIKKLVSIYKATVEEIESAISDSNISSVYNVNSPLEFVFHLSCDDSSDIDIEDLLGEKWIEADKAAA
ncbi:MAG: helix-turn-helix domain-containing protein [Proteobacteria bacterium]|nr:MAG: helix-turn-helix domain-containing protein [Pseudomonadota bacterium]